MAVTGAPTRDIGAPDLLWSQLTQGLAGDWWETAPNLLWPNSITTYGRMRHDPRLKAVVRAYVLPILRSTWVLDPEGCRDEVVQHCADDLGIGILGTDLKPGPARRRGVIWGRHLRDALASHLVYGHMPFERRYRIDKPAPGGCRLDNLGARNPWTIADIRVNRDGSVQQVTQNTQEEPIPASRLVWYVSEQEGANWAGISMLRPAYGAWLLKHETWRVHATSIRRFGMGVPGVEAPPGATQAQIMEARDLAASMRAGDQAGMGIPAGYKAFIMGMTGNVPDALAFVRYLDQQMSTMALAGLLDLGQTETGSRALGESFLDLFLLSLQAVADEVATTATSGHPGMPGIVTGLVDQNWGEDEPAPRVVCTDVGTNYEVTAEALASLVTAKALQADESLDAWIRERWRLPDRKGPWVSPATPPPANPPGGRGGGGAQEGPPGGGAPAPGPPGRNGGPPAQPPSQRRTMAAARRGLRRELSPIEVRAGWQPGDHQGEWVVARDALLAAYRPVVRAQRAQLVDQVAASVAGGEPGRLGRLAASAAEGAQVLGRHLRAMAETSAIRMAGEAASQGVHIPMDAVRIDTAKLGNVAQARATLAAAYYAQQAGSQAVTVVQAARPLSLPAQAAAAGQRVDDYLAGLSDRPLADQLGAALSAAQHHGRVAVLAAAPESAGRAEYVATELLDENTCTPCRDEDGHVFGSLAEADGAYPNGGFLGCLGGLRCRGTVVAVWEPAGQVAAAGWREGEHPRDPATGEWIGLHVRVTSGYHQGKTGHVVAQPGGNVKIRQANGTEFLTGAREGLIEPTGQPGIDVTPPPEPVPTLTERTARKGMRVEIPGEPGQTGEIIRLQRGPHGIPGAVVQYPQPTLLEGYAPHWVPLSSLRPASPHAAAWTESEHPRDEAGRFVHSPGAGSGGVAATDMLADYADPPVDAWIPPLRPAKGVKALTSAGRPNGAGTPDDPIDVAGDLDKALVLLAAGKHVRLNQPDEVALLVGKVNAAAKAVKAKGGKTPVWDFGKLTVKGTNLFAAEHRGIPRANMPQFSGLAQPGTEAARLAGGDGKFVDLGEQFAARLAADGIAVKRERVRTSHLRATQMELNGGKIAGFVGSASDPKNPRHAEALKALGEPIYITRDHYVIDGHHRWASNLALDALDGVLGNDTWQNVTEIDLDIGAAIPYALKFAQDMGIANRGVAAALAMLQAAMGYLAGNPKAAGPS